MPKKEKFKPEVTRVKLNAEQAVLTCACYDVGWAFTSDTGYASRNYCTGSKGYATGHAWASSLYS